MELLEYLKGVWRENVDNFHHEIFLESIDLKSMAKFIGEILFHKSVLSLSI